MEQVTNSNSSESVNESSVNNSTPDNSTDENIETDYNNNEENITNLGSTNNSQSINIQINSDIQDPYTQLFDDNPDNPFYKCKIEALDYDTDNEENEEYLRILIIWNYEFNYDYFHLNNSKIFLSKNESFRKMLDEIKNYRNSNNTNITGVIEKISNNGFSIGENAHIYLIVYYDNAKCNIELYGVFNQELEEDKVIKNIVDEKLYGTIGTLIKGTHITSVGGDGFLLIHNCINIE